MKNFSILILIVGLAFDVSAQVQLREATAAEVAAGTAGFPAVITPRRQRANTNSLTAAQAATLAAAVTNRLGVTNVFRWKNPNELWVSASTNASINGKYSWSGYNSLRNGTNSNMNDTDIAAQRYCPCWTNASGYEIFFWNGRNADGIQIYDYVLTRTNFDSETCTNVFSIAGTGINTYRGLNPLGVSTLNCPTLATNWDPSLNDAIAYDPQRLMPALMGGTIDVCFGTNIVTNISVTASSVSTNSVITVDPINGRDETASVGGLPFKKIQCADLADKQTGGNHTWIFKSGTNDLTWYFWQPTNAIVHCEFDSVFTTRDKTCAIMIAPFGYFVMNGGLIYQPIGYGFNGMAANRTFGLTNTTFNHVRGLCDYAVWQGFSGSNVVYSETMFGCDWKCGSWVVEPQQEVGAGRMDVSILNCKLGTYSWNPVLSEDNLFIVNPTCNGSMTVSGCELTLSNSFIDTKSGGRFFSEFHASGTNKLTVAGCSYINQGVKTNYHYYVRAGGVLQTNFDTTFDVTFATNRVRVDFGQPVKYPPYQ